ncbi:IS3 family transposase [Lactiplantibacillus plantarum]|uniref:DDE-type integrase/transposase/recombinase n=1 Tax=Lactiplantibacillus plantarum TaxID=1590 RepID=UPI000B554C6C|nr:DDE-type integrase/transposase/recombinase [Lactiplantibacillus plantarum]ARW35035.1 hypothetical protein S102022_01041 [Lactiplantibacillus plantarum]MCG0668441.1 IS3 family transposase [Lactiplantibacillus plantarum]WNJ68416.1 DDE-type integrase/transposase/recombinase [Lactiplantibacillus plantarum]
MSAVKDLYDGSIIAWQIASAETTQLVTEAMKRALKATHGVKPEILHSDQGSAYTSSAYNTLLAGEGIVHKHVSSGDPRRQQSNGELLESI